jgi:hypothetical protein
MVKQLLHSIYLVLGVTSHLVMIQGTQDETCRLYKILPHFVQGF